MSADGIDIVRVGERGEEAQREETRIEVTDVTFAWARSFVADRDAHFERVAGHAYLVLEA